MSERDASVVRRILRQPLVQFLVLGVALFALYLFFGGSRGEEEKVIVVSARQIQLLSSLWERQWRRPPTPEELNGLIQSFIREEVLYREALAMGLDQDDTVVRRRLAQKIEFLAQDLMAQVMPSEAELREPIIGTVWLPDFMGAHTTFPMAGCRRRSSSPACGMASGRRSRCRAIHS